MRGFWMILWILVSIGVLVLSACGGTQNSRTGDLSTPPAPPEAYAAKTNPLEGDQAAIQAGEEIYRINCVSCHGSTGAGDGPAAAGLTPKPQDLASRESALSDGYLYWRIAEGGGMAPFRSAMPAWKAALSEEKIWHTISYIRTLGE